MVGPADQDLAADLVARQDREVPEDLEVREVPAVRAGQVSRIVSKWSDSTDR
jgi:hypothetical protein